MVAMFLRSIVSLYSWNLPAALIAQLRSTHYSGGRLLRWFWHTTTFRAEQQTSSDHSWAVLLWLGILTQIGCGVGLLVEWARYGTAGAWAFGAALILSYPLVWAHLLALLATLGRLIYGLYHPKKAGRHVVCWVLERQVRALRRRHEFTVVAVVGSVGKTSTKLAIADLLAQTKRVRHQAGNYNDRVTVPLVLFGHTEPSLLNVFAWLKLFGANQAMIAHPYPYDVVVVELGTDGPGQLADFAYLRPDIAVVTAISPEHMEYFGTLDAVANEELSVFDFTKVVLVNADDIAGMYLAGRPFREYSLVNPQAHYYAKTLPKGLTGQELGLTLPGGNCRAEVRFVGRQGATVTLAAAAVADMLGIASAQIAAGLPRLSPFAGRMQILPGIKGSTLIDDTYNASPLAIEAALDVLYGAQAPQRIALLGSMNELGGYSQTAHEEVGAYCDPKKLDLVVTIGTDAGQWLAPVAQRRGCAVKSFSSPYDAGEYVTSILTKGAVILAKGSQNGVFAEEALKVLLKNSHDTDKLVRQSHYWLKIKAQQFGKPRGSVLTAND